MGKLKIPLAGFLVGLMVSIGIPGPVEATIAKKVPIDGGNYSANDEDYLELDTHFTGGHVDMHVGSWANEGYLPDHKAYIWHFFPPFLLDGFLGDQRYLASSSEWQGYLARITRTRA